MMEFTIIGNVGQQPELSIDTNQVPYTHFSVAVNVPNSAEASWFLVKVWGPLAEATIESIKRGMRIIVHGSGVSRSWVESGQKRSGFEIHATEIGAAIRFHTVTQTKRVRDVPQTEREAVMSL